MMILKKNKVKLENEDTITRRNPDSTSGIYLIHVNLFQCRQVAENRREKEEAKKEQKRRQPQERFISNSIDLILCIGA